MHKSFLFLQTRSPISGGPEAFDLALTAAAFDHEVRLVLADDGVEQESLAERGMAGPAGLPVVNREELSRLIAGADVVVTG
jgi:sulfur relay (sulfurtransferase) DsrF/TusC family protein